MNRRKFQKQILQAGLFASAGRYSNYQMDAVLNTVSNVENILPEALREGDTVGMIAPASSFPTSRIEKAEENMKALGLKVKWGANINDRHGYLAGKDSNRLSDIHDMFRDKEVRAIWCIRGGYGCTRIIDQLDYALIRQNPKILIGYSDVTAMLLAIYKKTGLVGFHGPVGSSTFSDYTLENVSQVLFGHAANKLILQSSDNVISNRPGFETYTIAKGIARGKLIGGNLSLLAAMCGTPYEMNVSGKILFMEDIEEKPYRIDRMLTQLRNTYDLTTCAGIMCGLFDGCQPDPDDRSLSLREAIEDRLGDLGIPVGYGFSFGHITDQVTLPVGIEAEIDTETMTYRLLEPCVS